MSTQAKLLKPHDPRLYSPNRDPAHNFDYVVKALAGRVEDGTWPELTRLAAADGVTMDDLGQGCQVLCHYVMGALDDKKETMAQALARSGWLDLRPTVRIVLMAYLGTIWLGIQWAGVREATLGGEGPLMGYADLIAFGNRQAEYMRMSRRRRRWERLRLRLRRAWEAFRREL